MIHVFFQACGIGFKNKEIGEFLKKYNIKDPDFQRLIFCLANFISLETDNVCDASLKNKSYLLSLIQISMFFGMNKEKLLCDMQDELIRNKISKSDLNLMEMIVKMKKSDDYFFEIMNTAFSFVLECAHHKDTN